MFTRKRKCEADEIWLTRIFEGLGYAAYVLLVTMLLSLVISILALPAPVYWGMWSAIVAYGAPSGLSPARKVDWPVTVQRVLRSLLVIESDNTEDKKKRI